MVLLRNIVKSAWNALGRGNRVSFDDIEKTFLFSGWVSPSLSNNSNSNSTEDGTDPLESKSKLTQEQIEDDQLEIEWTLGTLIANGYIKGYLSHERRIMVLSNTNAFPNLSQVGVGGLI